MVNHVACLLLLQDTLMAGFACCHLGCFLGCPSSLVFKAGYILFYHGLRGHAISERPLSNTPLEIWFTCQTQVSRPNVTQYIATGLTANVPLVCQDTTQHLSPILNAAIITIAIALTPRGLAFLPVLNPYFGCSRASSSECKVTMSISK